MGFGLDTLKELNPIKQLNDVTSYANPATKLANDIKRLTSIDFSRTYLWRVRFLPIDGTGSAVSHIMPPDFINGLPITEFDLEEAKVVSYNREFFMNTFKIPLKSSDRFLNMTFMDNVNHELYHWFKDWINIDILNGGQFISCVNDTHDRAVSTWSNGLPTYGKVSPTRKIFIERLAPDQTVAYSQTLTIYPEGTLIFRGASDSGTNVYSLSFVVIDDGEPKEFFSLSNPLFTSAASSSLDKVLNIATPKLDIGDFL
jgi:hypothetical protein